MGTDKSTSKRLYYLDNIRSFVIFFVILQHAALIYARYDGTQNISIHHRIHRHIHDADAILYRGIFRTGINQETGSSEIPALKIPANLDTLAERIIPAASTVGLFPGHAQTATGWQ